MSETDFSRLVADAIDSLPEDLLALLDNVAVVTQAWPSREQLAHLPRGGLLLGLYEGVPLTHRNNDTWGMLPDKITIFQGSIEKICRTRKAMAEQVTKTVIHEIAHHYGIGEERLRELGWG